MKNLLAKKFSNWEYWPSFMFYVPLLPYALYLAIRAKSFGFFSAVNPGIEGSGNGFESKYETLKLIPEKYRPKSIYVKKGDVLQEILPELKKQTINYPIIIKPDIGFRGLLVKKIHSDNELSNYLKNFNSINLIIQEFIELENECGIFYHRIPGEEKGTITSITLKKYLTVIGNGKSTLLELINNEKRAERYLTLITEINKNQLQHVPKMDEEFILNVIGNHSKGTQFINGNHLINPDLVKLFDTLNNQIDGWFYGRVDLKYHTLNELLNGVNFKIIEINGIISEPTHIYDSTNGSYYKALKSIKNHWKIAYTIGVKNHEIYNIKYTNLKYLVNLNFRYHNYLKKINALVIK